MTKAVSRDDLDQGRMTLMEHLIELRTRLIRCAIAVAVGAVVGWLVYPAVFDLLMHPLRELSHNPNVRDKLISLDPLEVFLLRVRMSAYLGIGIVMPFLLYQLYAFIAPGLYRNERRYALSFVISATVLFLMGAAIAYFTLPEALKFLQSLGGDNIEYQYSPQKYLTLIVYMMLAFGAGFEFPIVLVFLQLVGVVKHEQLSAVRRFAIVIIFVVAAVITPSADPVSLFALAIPMMIFYEISILIGRVVARRRARAEGG
jgi:sec-independent protein translocase protein TatC